MTTSDPSSLLPAVLALVAEAGAAIMAVYATAHDVEYKADDSPITRADRAAHEILSAGLASLAPSIPVLSEEAEASHAYAVRGNWRELWLVDPLDGTREFISRNGEFTVNVALISDHRPVLGVVGAPALGVTYFAASEMTFLAFLGLLCMWLGRKGLLKDVVNTEHYHDIGKLMFAFMVFWAYVNFSQYFLIQYADLPEETGWYRDRQLGNWSTIGAVLIFGHFLVPFAFLLSRHVKRNRGPLALAEHHVPIFPPSSFVMTSVAERGGELPPSGKWLE